MPAAGDEHQRTVKLMLRPGEVPGHREEDREGTVTFRAAGDRVAR